MRNIRSAVSLDVGASTYPATCSPEWRTQVLAFSLMLQMAAGAAV
jgi:hypothetical protein